MLPRGARRVKTKKKKKSEHIHYDDIKQYVLIIMIGGPEIICETKKKYTRAATWLQVAIYCDA